MKRTAYLFSIISTAVATFALAACSTGMSNAPAISNSTPSAPSATRASPEPSERPGLGTAWGETRFAPVHDVPFERDSDQPFSVVSVHYNDQEGAGAMAAHVASGESGHAGDIPVRTGLRVSVVDEDGLPLPAYASAGRMFVIGVAGRRYRLMVHNGTAHRLETVMSVDGLDVIDGSPAGSAKRGYVVDPYSTITVDGFRKSDRDVAAFRFSSVQGSYAVQTGGGADVGVIGWAFFAERGSSPWDNQEIEHRLSARPFSDSRYAQPPPGSF